MGHHNFLFKTFSLAALLSIILPVYADQDSSVLVQYPETEAVDLGMGWDLHKDKSVPNTCIENYQKYSVDKNIKDESFEQGNNSFTLQTQLDMSYKESLKASEKASGLGASESASASESSSMSMAASFDMSRDDRYILGKQRIVTRWDGLKSKGGLIRLTDEAKRLLAQDQDAFHRQCGHGYVARIEYGGTFYSLYNMHSSTYSSALDLKAHLEESASEKASIDEGVVKGKESASESEELSAHTSVESAVSKEGVDIHVSESGGTPSAAGTNVERVMEQYESFPKRVTESPTEFMMAVFPYPKASSLGEIQAPYMILSREYGKWLYLERQIGKVIAGKHDHSKSYVSIKGVTPSIKELEYMQKMAQDKIDIIEKSAYTCMLYIKKNKDISQKDLEEKCSLKDKKVPFRYKDKKSGKFKKADVPIEESDVYYLVRLPFSQKIYDGRFIKNQGTKNQMSYQDMIFNQVNGIYRERCGTNYISHYCENEAKVEAAVDRYIKPQQGFLYYQYKSYAGSGLCMSSVSGNNNIKIENCERGDLFAIDHKNRQVRVRRSDNLSESPDGCLFSENRSLGKGKHSKSDVYKIKACNKSPQNSIKNGYVYWEIEKHRKKKTHFLMLRDINFEKLHDGDRCADVNERSKASGTTVGAFGCKSPTDTDKNQKWKQKKPTFFLN